MGRRRSWTRHLIKRTDFEGITVKDGALRAARAPSPGRDLPAPPTSARAIQKQIAGRVSRGIVGEIAKRARAAQPPPCDHFLHVSRTYPLCRHLHGRHRRCRHLDLLA